MKKIINGKMYDTETAKHIGDRNNCEALYQKKTGEFFLYSESGITPLSFDEAREWAESKLDADVYIEIFGEPEEDDSKVLLSAYIRKDMFERIKQYAAKTGKTVSVLVEELLAVSMKGV